MRKEMKKKNEKKEIKIKKIKKTLCFLPHDFET